MTTLVAAVYTYLGYKENKLAKDIKNLDISPSLIVAFETISSWYSQRMLNNSRIEKYFSSKNLILYISYDAINDTTKELVGRLAKAANNNLIKNDQLNNLIKDNINCIPQLSIKIFSENCYLSSTRLPVKELLFEIELSSKLLSHLAANDSSFKKCMKDLMGDYKDNVHQISIDKSGRIKLSSLSVKEAKDRIIDDYTMISTDIIFLKEDKILETYSNLIKNYLHRIQK